MDKYYSGGLKSKFYWQTAFITPDKYKNTELLQLGYVSGGKNY